MGLEGSLSFPAGPVIGQTYDHGGRTYQWNGVGWRQVFPAQAITPVRDQFINLTAAFTLISQTAAQNMFPVGGIVLSSSLTYFFECLYNMTGLSAVSGAYGFALGGTAVLSRQAWLALACKTSALPTANSNGGTYNTAANVAIANANTSTTGSGIIKGVLRVGAGGTLIPQISLGQAAAAVVGVESYFRIRPIGPATIMVGSVGD